jgi:hypothetical protein
MAAEAGSPDGNKQNIPTSTETASRRLFFLLVDCDSNGTTVLLQRFTTLCCVKAVAFITYYGLLKTEQYASFTRY